MKFKTSLLLLIALLLPCHATTKAKAATPAKASKTITLETNLGNIVLQLFDDKAPMSCANFRRYVHEHFYDGLIFHRVIPGFMIQGGGFEPGMQMRTAKHPPIKNEASNGLKNKRGTIAMARTWVVNSATSQFFINLKDNDFLDHTGNSPRTYGYAVFGKVIKGMDVVDKIAASPTTTVKGYRNVPVKAVVIKKAFEN